MYIAGHTGLIGSKSFHNYAFKGWIYLETMKLWLLVQANLDLRNPIFPFLNRELFDLRKIYVVNLKTGRPKKMPYVGEFAT